MIDATDLKSPSHGVQPQQGAPPRLIGRTKGA